MKEGVSVGVCSVLRFLTKRRSLPYHENAGKPSGRCEAERMNTATSASRLARAVCISASARARGIGAVLFRFEYDGTSVEGALAGEANDNIAHLKPAPCSRRAPRMFGDAGGASPPRTRTGIPRAIQKLDGSFR